MAKKEPDMITSEEAGSAAGTEGSSYPGTEVAAAVQGQYPEGYEDADEQWKAAYDFCARKRNPVKACILWADAHANEEQDESMSRPDFEARIAELEAKLAEKA